jgi:hypothetical protein
MSSSEKPGYAGALACFASAKEHQTRRNEEHEGFFLFFFTLFVSSWMILIASMASITSE